MSKPPKNLQPVAILANEILQALALMTPEKRRELIQARLDLAHDCIRLRPEDTKTALGRVIPLTGRCVAALKALPRSLRSR